MEMNKQSKHVSVLPQPAGVVVVISWNVLNTIRVCARTPSIVKCVFVCICCTNLHVANCDLIVFIDVNMISKWEQN